MDTITLRTFIALAQIKNFTHTSEQLFVAQSTVTNRIRDLERELNKKLFIRTHKHVELTPEGEKFLDYAQRFISLELAAYQDLQSTSHYDRIVRIGATNTIYECHLQKAILDYLKSHSSIALNINISHTTEMLHNLQYGTLDVVFTYSAMYRDGFICKPYRTDTLDLVCSIDDTAYVDGIYKKDLEKIKYIFCNFALQGVGLYIQDLFPQSQRYPMEIDNSTKVPLFVAAGIGYSFLPHSLVEDDLKKKRLRKIPLLDFAPPKVSSFYITRASSPIPEELERYLLYDNQESNL